MFSLLLASLTAVWGAVELKNGVEYDVDIKKMTAKPNKEKDPRFDRRIPESYLKINEHKMKFTKCEQTNDCDDFEQLLSEYGLTSAEYNKWRNNYWVRRDQLKKRPKRPWVKEDQWHKFAKNKAYRLGDFKGTGEGYCKGLDNLLILNFVPPKIEGTCTIYLTANYDIELGKDFFSVGWNDVNGNHTLTNSWGHFKYPASFQDWEWYTEDWAYWSPNKEEDPSHFTDAMKIEYPALTGKGEIATSFDFPYNGGSIDAWMRFKSDHIQYEGGEGIVVSQFSIKCKEVTY